MGLSPKVLIVVTLGKMKSCAWHLSFVSNNSEEHVVVLGSKHKSLSAQSISMFGGAVLARNTTGVFHQLWNIGTFLFPSLHLLLGSLPQSQRAQGIKTQSGLGRVCVKAQKILRLA